MCGAKQLNTAPPYLVLTPGTENRPQPDDLRGLDGSKRSSKIRNQSVLFKSGAGFF